MHISLKRIGKILFVLVLITLLIWKFPNFTTVFTNKEIKTFQSLQLVFRVKKLISGKHILLMLAFIVFEEYF